MKQIKELKRRTKVRAEAYGHSMGLFRREDDGFRTYCKHCGQSILIDPSSTDPPNIPECLANAATLFTLVRNLMNDAGSSADLSAIHRIIFEFMSRSERADLGWMIKDLTCQEPACSKASIWFNVIHDLSGFSRRIHEPEHTKNWIPRSLGYRSRERSKL